LKPSIVYVVDDDEAVRESLSLLLEEHGLTVRGFASCEAFLDAFDGQEESCLILDLHLPGMDGLSLLRHLASVPVRLVAIAITGRMDTATAAAVRAAGAAALLEKPFERAELLETIARAMTKRA